MGRKKSKGITLNEDMEPFITYGTEIVSSSYMKDKDGNWVPATTTTPVTQAKVWCKHGPAWAFSHDGMHFYGAAGFDVTAPVDYDLVFDLANAILATKRAVHKLVKTGPARFQELNSTLLPPPEFVDIEWADFGITSNAGYDFWRGMADAIAAEAAVKHVLVCCSGGHGRTGSFLSIVYGMLNNITDGDKAIAHIRGNYCERAVETDAQEQYIRDVLAGKY